MALEIERKFLLSGLPPVVAGLRPERIVQGYIAVVAEGTEVRLRRAGSAAFLTVKRGAGLERAETEIRLSAEQFDDLWPAAAENSLEKRRYTVDTGDVVVQVDEFLGRLSGLVLAEVEFLSREAAERYSPPPWLGQEVTGDARYSNAHLAVSSSDFTKRN